MLRQGHRRCGVLWLSFLLLVLTLAFSGAAKATLWQAGDVISYNQGNWGGDPLSDAGAATLVADYGSVYASTGGLFEVGIPGPSGFSMLFSGASALLTYLPQSGPIGALTGDLLDPTSSSSGAFGGEVVALKLNVDFSDAGFVLGASAIPFGDLVLENFTTLPNLNGLTVRQFLGDVEVLLGGGTSVYGIADLYNVAQNVNASFQDGAVSDFALDHLVAPTAAVPEPSAMLLLGSGLIGLWGARKKFKK